MATFKNNKLVVALALSIFLVSCAKNNNTTSPEHTEDGLQQVFTKSKAVPNEFLAQISSSTSLKEIQKSYQITEIDKDSHVYLLSSSQIKNSEARSMLALKEAGLVDEVQPNYIKTVGSEVKAPKDRKWLELWGLKNYGQDAPRGSEGLKGADIKALEAWNITKGSKDVVVAVIDTGVDYKHPDLRDNMWINEKESPENGGIEGVDDDGNGYVDDIYGWNFVSGTNERPYHGQLGSSDPMDDHGHGTHVSGTIGAKGNNLEGVVGVNWNVRIMALKFLNKSGSGSTADEIRAIRYAIKSGVVDVVNASFGGGPDEPFVKQMLKELGEKGTLFVAAAGNDGEDGDVSEHYPSSYDLDTVLSVAATDNRDQIATFSNYGQISVDLAAPGVNITSTYPTGLDAQNPYRTWSGTSMATPHAVGAAALVLAAHPELRKKPVELKKALMNSVDWLPQLAGKTVTGGRLNLLNAVELKPGSTPINTQLTWTTELYDLKTPMYPTELISKAWKIEKKGAKAIRAHIKSANTDGQYDLAMIYDSVFRPITRLPEVTNDYWTPAVQGDSMYLKFSNALVKIQKVVEIKNVDDPDSIPKDQINLIMSCQPAPNGKWNCLTYDKPGEPFANFTSESIEIDQISYLK